MEKPVTSAVIDTGIIDFDDIEQLRRWGLLAEAESHPENYPTHKSVLKRIREAVGSEDAVEMRKTDLDLAKDWEKEHSSCRLYVPVPDERNKVVGINIEYHRTKMGDYVIPWTTDNIFDLMLDEETHLRVPGVGKVYFVDVEELYYGAQKVFMICTPAARREKV